MFLFLDIIPTNYSAMHLISGFSKEYETTIHVRLVYPANLSSHRRVPKQMVWELVRPNNHGWL